MPEDIEAKLGTDVAMLVKDLTDVSRPSDGNRGVRKAIDRSHLVHTQDIVTHDWAQIVRMVQRIEDMAEAG